MFSSLKDQNTRTASTPKIVCATAGMSCFWQLLRYSNINAVFTPWASSQDGAMASYLLLLALVAAFCLCLAFVPKLRKQVPSVRTIIGASLASSLVLGFAPLASANMTDSPLAIIFTLLLAIGFVVLIRAWTIYLANTIQESFSSALMILLLSSMATLLLSLAISVAGSLSPLLRAPLPLLSAVLLIVYLHMTDDSLAIKCAFKNEKERSCSPLSLRWLFWLIFLLVLSTLAKGAITPVPLGIFDSPDRIYSTLITVIVGLVLAMIANVFDGRRTLIAYCACISVSVVLAAGFFALGFIGEKAAFISAACMVTSRAWVEAMLLLSAILWGMDRWGVFPSVVTFFILPELASSFIRRFLLPWIAQGSSIPLFSLMEALSLPLGVLFLVVCCLVLGKLAFNGMVEDASDTKVTEAESGSISLDGFAKKYSLTARETEIVGYLLRGYSLPLIAEEEVLSLSTVQTHCRNIYRKLGIHSKSELIKLVEAN